MYKKIFSFLQQPVTSNYTFNFIFLPLNFFIKNLKQKTDMHKGYAYQFPILVVSGIFYNLASQNKNNMSLNPRVEAQTQNRKSTKQEAQKVSEQNSMIKAQGAWKSVDTQYMLP